MSDFRADLHLHSNFSDGTLSPLELIKEAKAKGLQGISITDHDSISAYPEVLTMAQKEKLLMITGVELSANFENENVHVLGYSFSPKSKELRDLCARHKQRRRERNERILNHLKKIGIHLEMSELYTQNENEEFTIGRPHIAMLLIQRGVCQSVQEAFDKYLGEGKKAYDPGEPISLEESISTLHQAKGVAILAHPHLIKRGRFIKKLIELPFDGIEVYYAYFPKEQESKWLNIALEKGWIATGGSDYHGSIKPFSQLGSSWVDEQTFRTLYTHFLKSIAD